MLVLTACSIGPAVLPVDDAIDRLQQQVDAQQEVIISITTHFSQLSNDYVLLERRVEALEAAP